MKAVEIPDNGIEYTTQYGHAYLGDAIDVFDSAIEDQTLDLVVTSPPYALITKKSYGNVDEDAYVDWFLPFAESIKNKLCDSGSLVLNVGGAWTPAQPTRSLYVYKLLIALCDRLGFSLAQEFYWFNPAKMPAPIQWVNKERIRVKDSVELVFWLSKTPFPKADNTRVLVEYSDSMKRLIKTKRYNWGERPSGYKVGKNWAVDHGGAIPPNLIIADEARRQLEQVFSQQTTNNLLVESNTRSQTDFQNHCRQMGYEVHPARFPPIIPEFFIRFLTDEGDLVCDPFAGSNTTGEVAEKLKRRWVSAELDPDYFLSSSLRFRDVHWTP